MSNRDIQAIKAELYDLQGHVCDGRFTVHADGHLDPGNCGCSGCSRILELQHQLRQAAKMKTRELPGE